jgi:hypothetical protein
LGVAVVAPHAAKEVPGTEVGLVPELQTLQDGGIIRKITAVVPTFVVGGPAVAVFNFLTVCHDGLLTSYVRDVKKGGCGRVFRHLWMAGRGGEEHETKTAALEASKLLVTAVRRSVLPDSGGTLP